MRKLAFGLLVAGFLMGMPSTANACLGPYSVPGTLTVENDGSYTCQATGPMTCPVGYKRTNVTAYIDIAGGTCDIEWYCCKNPLPRPLPDATVIGPASTVVIGAACLPMSEPELALPVDVESTIEEAAEVAA